MDPCEQITDDILGLGILRGRWILVDVMATACVHTASIRIENNNTQLLFHHVEAGGVCSDFSTSLHMCM